MNERTDKLAFSIQQFEKALTRLAEALGQDFETNPLVIDATIQRFEFCYELCWKTLKIFLSEKGIIVTTPKDTFRESYAANIIGDEDIWLSMIKDRNLTSHTYQEDLAREIYNRAEDYLKIMNLLLQDLKSTAQPKQ